MSRPVAGRIRRAFFGVVLALPVGCDSATTPIKAPGAVAPGAIGASQGHAPRPAAAAPESSPFGFTEIAQEAGIDFVHVSGMTPEKHFPTANGSGAAMFDYDGDGQLDLYFATATHLPVGTAPLRPNRLYKNLGVNRFRDVTETSGLGYRGFCHGIVTGDIDNDGDPDVFLCNYGPNVLYLNNGDGTFRDISHSAGVDRTGWSSGGAFLDYDEDGDLDLYVANYGEWEYPRDDLFCGDRARHVRIYCSPRTIRTVKHILYRNNGDRTFTDVTEAAGLGRAIGHGFGVVAADLDGDGRIDVYVANDTDPNFLFLNRGDGTFRDATYTSGAAFDERGNALSGMGADAEDINGDGRPELLVTTTANEANALYQNNGGGVFVDATRAWGITAQTMPWVGWGTALADFDNDGWPDNFVANGQVDDNRRALGQPVAFEEPPLLFQNLAGKRFRLATRGAGRYFETKHVGRGAAFGDIDNDGDVDIVVNHMDRPPALLRNDSKHGNHWIRLDLQGTWSNRDAVGAQVRVVAGGRTIVRQRKGGCSVESANDPRLLIGVGTAAEVESLIVRWPRGAITTRTRLAVNRAYQIVEPARGDETTGRRPENH